jgi:hypothetical protein
MKGLLIRIAVGFAVLAALFYILACGPGSPNSNVGLAPPTPCPSCSPTPDPHAGADEAACNIPNLTARKNAVNARIALKIDENPELMKIFRGFGGKPPRFSIRTEESAATASPLFLDVYVEGGMNNKEFMDALTGRLKNFVKQGCVHRVFFKEGPATVGTLTARGFEWHYCEYPQVACSNGTCQDNCGNSGTGNIGHNTNVNNNSNTNTGPANRPANRID